MARVAAAQYSPSEFLPGAVLSDFYREEFLKHLEFLRLQREYYSEPAVARAEAALDRILDQFEALCTMRDADQLFSRLLRSFDLVTGVSALSDPKKAH
jgi:Zn-dependent M32 family carboxypeptidase